ncbi:hypothetical protein N3K66_007013 [Trichothecium roseum]|uniref:Uncharacterized protein n=1 Tax=Trichothecium roseum TaxID=47278 RepID=A0ACC0UZK5_9HYPO|nr:hypothetical protein N3K66_007013 [Trichothecium roseum]
MPETIDHKLSGPPFQCLFSPVDQVTPPIYSRRILIFSHAPDHDRENTVLALKTGLQRAIDEFPVLAGQMGYVAPGGWTIKPGVARLRIKHFDSDPDDDELTFERLQESGFCESLLPADLVSSVPTLADPQEDWHACRLQANFIRGGLLLVVSVNHTVMDGYGITKVIQSLARHSRLSPTSPHVHHSDQTVEVTDRAAIFNQIGTNSKANVDDLDAYSIVQGPTNLSFVPPRTVTTTIRLAPQALRRLKITASPEKGWVTTHDAVNALCWRAHAAGRRRAGIIQDHETARFAFPVDIRRLLGFPPGYVGNAVLMTKVSLPVKTLLDPKDGLKAAAAAIRAGVARVDAAYAENFVSVAQNLDEPGKLKINLKLEVDGQRRETAFGSTSYKSFDLSGLEWDEVAVGRYERMRLASGVTGEGMSIVLPVLADGSWEVTVSLEEELVDAFRANEDVVDYAG